MKRNGESSKFDQMLVEAALRKAVQEEGEEAEKSPWFIGFSVALWLAFAAIVGLAAWHQAFEKCLWCLLVGFGSAVFYNFSHRPELEEYLQTGRSTELVQFSTLVAGLCALVYAVQMHFR